MAITEAQLNERERESKNLLEVDTHVYYFNKLRPLMVDIMIHCKTDLELLRTIDKAMNAADSLCIRKEYKELGEALVVLNTGITDKNYFNGIMSKAPEKEKEMVRDLIQKIQDLQLIIKCEPEVPKEDKKQKDRLDYNSPNGENNAYYTHNMAILTKPVEQTRIPNV